MGQTAPHALCAILAVTLAVVSPLARSAEALVAVAANFAPAAAALKLRFEADSAHEVRLASGSTGKLYAQIRNGAPFDLLLAADGLRPELLENEGLGIAGSRFTYAVGRLAVWIPGAMDLSADNVSTALTRTRRIAMANPALAPYGLAAQETLTRLQIELEARIAVGENVAQAYAMVASGAADGGLVAWSHVVSRGNQTESWLVPQAWHSAIRQDAVLLQHGAANEAARAFMTFLKAPATAAFIAEHGYPDSG